MASLKYLIRNAENYLYGREKKKDESVNLGNIHSLLREVVFQGIACSVPVTIVRIDEKTKTNLNTDTVSSSDVETLLMELSKKYPTLLYGRHQVYTGNGLAVHYIDLKLGMNESETNSPKNGQYINATLKYLIPQI